MTFELVFLRQFVYDPVPVLHEGVVELTPPHTVQVEENDPGVETLETSRLPDLSSGVRFPVEPQDVVVVRGQIAAHADHLVRVKLLVLPEQLRPVHPELQIHVQHDELAVRKHPEKSSNVL